ncbi:MAG TPA: type II toxin-antitoxin system VapC family toxin [Acidobacteriota bacterium]|jgi:predicted nucleic-acid-binding protein|nr:type II toxin-antitoxin system VapC family toxin [Acidobacteriota bacterium]
MTIALDTNVLIRLLIGDDSIQAKRAKRLLESAWEQGERCFVSDPVLCELEWVLDSAYGASRHDVAMAIQELLSNKIFVVENEGLVQRAVDHYARGRADFSDYLLGVRGQAKGARTTYTFDKALRHEEGFTLLS